MAARNFAGPKGQAFYVYQFTRAGSAVYVGKGTGTRFQTQCRRFADCEGEIVKWFHSETAAFKHEERLIAKLNPSDNIVAGGRGARARKPKWQREMEAVGLRRYSARLLLRFDLKGYIEPSKIEAIRQVANGPRC